jgi:cytoskeletal protein RodZ
VNPLRVVATARRAVRAQVHRAAPATVGSSALKQQPSVLPEISELRRTEGKVGLVIETVPASPPAPVGVADRATPIAIGAPPVASYRTQPAAQPLIGPQLKAARTQVRITVDALAERTRIRPHVIESIEVDDFAPCGGDFYARGHLRSLCRTLGIDAAGLVEIYDREYAQAPVAARRVFEAELATGPQAAIRSTGGGPRWSVLLGVVMVLTIVWGAAKIVTDRTADPRSDTNASVQPVLPVLPEPTSGATGLESLGAPRVNSVKLVASSRTRVAVRDADGSLVWRGVLTSERGHRVDVDGPATIRAAKSAAVRLVVNGKPRGVVDKAGGPAQRTVGRAGRRVRE